MKFLLVLSLLCSSAWATLQFSAGFSNDAVLQRSTAAGAAVYGFTDTAAAVTVAVTGTDGKGAAVSYKVQADVHAWTGGKDIHPDTPPPPPHGAFVWRAALKPAAAGGALKITARNGAAVNGTASINGVTHGDVWFCRFGHCCCCCCCCRRRCCCRYCCCCCCRRRRCRCCSCSCCSRSIAAGSPIWR